MAEKVTIQGAPYDEVNEAIRVNIVAGGSSGGGASGGLTDDELRAAPVEISDPFGATAARQDIQTVALGAPTDPSAGTGSGSIIGLLKSLREYLAGILYVNLRDNQNPPVTSITIPNQTYPLSLNGRSCATFQLTGTWSGDPLIVRATADNTNYVNTYITNVSTGEIMTTIPSGATGLFRADVAGIYQIQIRAGATFTGSLTIGSVEGSGIADTLASFLRGSTPVSGAGLPVSGPLTNTQLRASAVVTSSGDTVATGTISALNASQTGTATANSAVEIDTNGASTVTTQWSGTMTATMTFYGTVNGVTWFQLPSYQSNSQTPSFNTTYSAAAQNAPFTVECSGFSRVRLQTSAYTSGSIAVTMRTSKSAHLPYTNVAVGVSPVNIQTLSGQALATTGVSGSLPIAGPVAHSQSSNQSPVMTGGKVVTAQDATLAAGDVAQTVSTTNGAQVIKPYAVPELDWQSSITVTTTTQTAIRASGGAGIRNYCTGIQYQNTSATATLITIQDGASTVAVFNAPASMGVPALLTFPTPLKTTANTALNVTCGTGGANLILNAQGYVAP